MTNRVVTLVSALWGPEQGLRPAFMDDIYRLEGATAVVSRGLGPSRFPLRVFNPGEVVVIDCLPDASARRSLRHDPLRERTSMTPHEELTKARDETTALIDWYTSNGFITRQLDQHEDAKRSVKIIRSFLDREVPTAADPVYVDGGYDAVRVLLQVHRIIDNVVSPELERAHRDGTYDRTTVEMTRSVLGSNNDRLLDATADLYVALSRWLGLDVAYECIRTRFAELTERDRWSPAEDLPSE